MLFRSIGERCTPPIIYDRNLSCVKTPNKETYRRLYHTKEYDKPTYGPNEGTCVHFNRDPPGVGECTPGWPAP